MIQKKQKDKVYGTSRNVRDNSQNRSQQQHYQTELQKKTRIYIGADNKLKGYKNSHRSNALETQRQVQIKSEQDDLKTTAQEM